MNLSGYAQLMALASMLFGMSAGADVSPAGGDIEYAETVPLAPESLLLDIRRSGETLIAAGERGHIILSGDQGQSWTQAEHVPTRSTLTSLVVSGGRLWAAGHDSVILTSGDGGKTWTRQYFDAERQQPIMDIWFADAKQGIAIGAYGLMLVTSDGGQNWEDWAVNDEDDAHLNSLVELPDGRLLIAGEAGYSYRSDDRGESWETMEMPYGGSMFGAVLAADNCVLFFGLRGHIQRSCDRGDSWEELDSGSESTLIGGVTFSGGALMVGNGGTLVTYHNGGRLEVSTHPSGVDFAAVISIGEGRFLMTGEEGTYRYPVASPEGNKP